MVFEKQPAFFLIDVEAEMAQLATFQGANERLAVDQATAARINQHCTVFHAGECGV